jgi:hypothetical protein
MGSGSYPAGRALFTVAVLAGLLLAACGDGGGGAGPTSTRGPTTTTRAPRRVVEPGRENVAFFYQQIRRDANLARLGTVKTIVAGIQNDGAGAAARIHEHGAQAYRYVQSYWFPSDRTFDGLDLAQHRDWAYCESGSEPKEGRTDTTGAVWWFLDMNEREVHDWFREKFSALKAEGWDGVFFDRGYASLTGFDAANYGIWDQVSTCTESPAERSATFADAYVGLMDVAREVGMPVMMNYGVSPFDANTPLRPDPRDEACIQHDFARCSTLDDAWESATYLLDEAISHPKDKWWKEDFAANLRNEQDAERPGRVVGLLTTATIGTQNRKNVYYAWSRVKLFAIPLGVNTGDRGCAAAKGAPCNRHALYPELADVTYGAPISAMPESLRCDPGSDVHCLWLRRYEQGMTLVNASARAKRTGALTLGVEGCRYVLDLYTGRPLAGNRCVTSVSLALGPWEGHPLQYATRAF